MKHERYSSRWSVRLNSIPTQAIGIKPFAPGPYVKLDVGAGTSHSSLFRIYGDLQTPKRGIGFFGVT